MNGFCRDTPASNACYGCTVATDDICPAHNPEPDEAAESARTSGSPTGSRSDSCGTTEVQLAPVDTALMLCLVVSHINNYLDLQLQ